LGISQFHSNFISTFPNKNLEKIPALSTLFYAFILPLLKNLEIVIAILNNGLLLISD
jgi:hypothetical protein